MSILFLTLCLPRICLWLCAFAALMSLLIPSHSRRRDRSVFRAHGEDVSLLSGLITNRMIVDTLSRENVSLFTRVTRTTGLMNTQVMHNNARGPFFGGTIMHPDITLGAFVLEIVDVDTSNNAVCFTSASVLVP